MTNAIRRRIDALMQHLAPPATGEDLAHWKDIVNWRAGDKSPELLRRLGPWGPRLPITKFLPVTSRPKFWNERFRIALPAVVDVLLDNHPADDLKTPAWLNIALRETADLIINGDWPSIVEHDTVALDGSRGVIIIFPDGQRVHYSISPAGRVIRLGDWQGEKHDFERTELTAEEFNTILESAIR